MLTKHYTHLIRYPLLRASRADLLSGIPGLYQEMAPHHIKEQHAESDRAKPQIIDGTEIVRSGLSNTVALVIRHALCSRGSSPHLASSSQIHDSKQICDFQSYLNLNDTYKYI